MLSDDEVLEAVAVFEANHGKLEGYPGWVECVPGTCVVSRMCELREGIQARFETLKPKTISVLPRGGDVLEVPWHENMLTKEVKLSIEKQIGVARYSQRLMFDDTELKVGLHCPTRVYTAARARLQ